MNKYLTNILCALALGAAVMSWVGCEKPVTNNPPATPSTPSGPASAKVNESVMFSTVTTDPDGDQVSYQFDWGDGEASSWSSYTTSGDSVSMSHSYSAAGTYSVTVKAKDSNSDESGWSGDATIVVTQGQTPLLWKYGPFAGAATNYPPALGSDGTIYFTADAYLGHLYAVDQNGGLKWVYDPDISGTSREIGTCPALGSSGTIYVEAMNNWLCAVNAGGSLVWKYVPGTENDPAIGADGTIYCSTGDGKLYALNSNGTIKWTYDTGLTISIDHGPVIDASGTIYFPTRVFELEQLTGAIFAMKPDGTLKWQSTAAVPTTDLALGGDGTIYFGSYSYLYALNPADGSVKWSYDVGSSDVSNPVIGPTGEIYFSTYYKLYSVNAGGSLNWTYEGDEYIESTPAIGSDSLGLNYTIYVGNNAGIYAIATDGSLKGEFGSDICSEVISSPIIGSNGVLYFVDLAHYLYAVTCSSKRLAATPWPRERHDNWNTGRAGGP